MSWNPLVRDPVNKRFFSRAKSAPLEVVKLIAREEIGLGGTAIVYRTTYSNGWHEVEKILTPKFQNKRDYEELQTREFEILSKLNHPLIVRPARLQIKPALGGGETRVLILEYVDGVSLSQLWPFVLSLDSVTRVNWAYEILVQLSSIVAYLGEKKVVHGDIAPENVLIQPNGLIKLIDFGVASTEEHSTPAFLVAGRNYFRAPELRHSGQTSHSGDIFAVGRIFEQLLGDENAAEGPHQEILTMVTESRELPPVSFHAGGWFEGLSPLPASELLKPKVCLRPKTKLTPKPPLIQTHRKKLLAASLLALFPLISTWQPHSAKITINSLPYSTVIFDNIKDQLQYETPIRAITIPSGKHRIQFVIPSQNHRKVVRQIFVMPGDDVKIFEDFRNLDTLKK